jgi:hypothetical protein
MTFKEMKDEYIDHLKTLMVEEGFIPPIITVFAKNLENDEKAVIHIPIPAEFMKDDASKDEFVEKVFPNVAKKLKEDFNPVALVWSAEAWMTIMDEDEQDKKEVVMISVETNKKQQSLIYEIKRNGMEFVKDKGLVEKIELDELINQSGLKAEGRFVGLFKNFNDNV